MFENDLEERRGRSAGRKTGEQEMLDQAIMMRSLKRGLGRLGRQERRAVSRRGRRVALDPGTEVGRRMLVAILVRLAERMVQFERRGQRRKGQQAEAQQGDNEDYGKPFRHSRP